MVEKSTMIDDFCKKAALGEAAFFIGAGLSIPYGLPNFEGLVKELMSEKKISYSSQLDDYPQMIQFVANKSVNKKEVHQLIKKRFNITYDKTKSTYYESIAQSNVNTIWTTNFDTLIEQALDSIEKPKVVKNNEKSFSRSHDSYNKVEILKIHGDIHSKKIVVTKNDYEDFNINQKIAIKRLEHDLLTKSIMFLGYSYNDPNIQNVVNSIRQLLDNKMDPKSCHYLLLLKEKERRKNKNYYQDLWVEDLERYGIKTFLFDDYSQLEGIIEEISRKTKGNTIYATGSHNGKKRDKLGVMATKLGGELSQYRDILMHFGQSTGYGYYVCQNFAKKHILKKQSLENRIKIFPNPYSFCKEWQEKEYLFEELTALRTEMLRKTQVVIAFPGGEGTIAEIKIAVKEGAIIIPIFYGKEEFKDEVLEIPNVIDKLDKVDKQFTEKVLNSDVSINDLLSFLERILGNEKLFA